MENLEGECAHALLATKLVFVMECGQLGTLAKLEDEPAPKVVEVNMSENIPLKGDKRKAHEEEHSLNAESQQVIVALEDDNDPCPRVTIVVGPLPLTVAKIGGSALVNLGGILSTHEAMQQ